MAYVTSKNNKGIFVVAFLLLASSNFLSYVNLNATLHSKFFRVLVALLVFFIIINWGKIKQKSKEYASFWFVTYFAIAPFITHVSCYLEHGQSLISSVFVSASSLVFFIYFFCVLRNVSEEKIIRILLVITILKIGLTLIQQFTYPDILFSFTSDKIDDEGIFRPIQYRSGFYRFLISDAYYLTVFLGFYSLCKYVQEKLSKYIFLFFIACFGLYMDQTRQILAVFFIVICLFPLIIGGVGKRWNVLPIFIVLLILVFIGINYDSLFGELAERTESEANNADYVRFLSFEYFWNNTGDWITTLFGNGWAGLSQYGETIRSMQEDYSIVRPDVGIVGALHKMGAIFILSFLLYYLVVLRKNWRFIDPEYKMIFLFLIIDTPLIFPLYNFTLPCIECFMGLLFYLVDSNITKNRIMLNYSEYGRE